MQERGGPSRCSWVNLGNPTYVRYHDEEWGRPVQEDGKLFEIFLLETFQAGLSWECVLNKREAFRQAFDGFEVQAIATYGEEKVEALVANPGLIRHRAKIKAAIQNAQAFLRIQTERGSFADYLWSWTEGRILRELGRTTSPLAEALAKDLKRRGLAFVGATTVYAYLQAVGVIQSHEATCFLRP